MKAWLESFGVFALRPDSRPSSEIEGDILEELRFHLAERAADNMAAGMSPTEAHADAESRFGDFRRIRSACRRVQLGERIMLQRLHFITVLVLLCVVLAFGYQSIVAQRRADAQAAQTREDMKSQMAQLRELLVQAERSGGGAALNAGLGTLGGPGEASHPARAQVAPQQADHRDAVEVPFDPRTWLARVPAFDEGWRVAAALGREIAALEPDQAIEVLETIWSAVENPAHRQQLLKYTHESPHGLRVLHLGASDDDPGVRGWAFDFMKDIAFIDFSEEPAAYAGWYAEFGELPLSDVVATNATRFVQRMGLLQGADLAKALRQFDRLDLRNGESAGADMVQVFRDAGAFALIDRWILYGDGDTRTAALGWLAQLEPTEQELRSMALPVLEDVSADSSCLGAACDALGKPGQSWAVDPLVGFMQDALDATQGELSSGLWSGARALADIGDHRAIPDMIALILKDDTYNTVYGVGHFGLRELTGVSYDESHDGAWWAHWWEENRHQYPSDVAALEIPD